MDAEAVLGPEHVRRRLHRLPRRDVNFRLDDLRRANPAEGWKVTDICQPLVSEPPGDPLAQGSWEIARRLMWGYEFADPSIVRAYYDLSVPLKGRNMLLKLQAFGVLHLYVGVRVVDVYEQTRVVGDRAVRVWGWAYRTLEGHVEAGQMDWQVWKWLDNGEVEFRVHSVSRRAAIANPVIRVGFGLLEPHERAVFLNSTTRRMRTFVELALGMETDDTEPLRAAAAALTARRSRADVAAAHDQLASQLDRQGQVS